MFAHFTGWIKRALASLLAKINLEIATTRHVQALIQLLTQISAHYRMTVILCRAIDGLNSRSRSGSIMTLHKCRPSGIGAVFECCNCDVCKMCVNRWLHHISDEPPTIAPHEQHKWLMEHKENTSIYAYVGVFCCENILRTLISVFSGGKYVPYSTTRTKIQAWQPAEKQ